MDTAAEPTLALLLTEHGQRLAGRARALTGSAQDAEDAVQEVLLDLVEAPCLLGGVERLGAWLVTLVARRCVDLLRSDRRRRTRDAVAQDMLDLVAGSPDPEAMFQQQQVVDAVAQAVNALPHDEREAFVANALEGKTFRELADETGVPMGTWMARKKRAMGRIRRQLAASGLLTDDS